MLLYLTIGSQTGYFDWMPKVMMLKMYYSGIEFLRNMEMTGQRYDFKGKKVAVVGGGNTAMDCCRTSLRCGSTDVKVIYQTYRKRDACKPN
jgi:NADPH-dependent glutamate synthase beta subunit-like oxidoreductase